ncbi:MAG: hypothetical protein PHE89_07815 [Alphaproteobacteria bacterium]|nr:hypothetical protein [Alphaproteobacteria bacterium]
MVHNKTSLNVLVQDLVNAGAGIFKGGSVEYVKLPHEIQLETSEGVNSIAKGVFISIDGNCSTLISKLLKFVGRKQIVGYV